MTPAGALGRKRWAKYDAAADALSVLSPREVDAFVRWRELDNRSISEDHSRQIRLLKFTNWQVMSGPPEISDSLLEAEGQRLVELRRLGLSESFALAGADLLVCREEANDRANGHIAVLSPDAVSWFMSSCFPEAGLTRALRRVMVCYITGLSLSQIATLEDKSVDTIKSQSRELRRRLALERTDDIARIVGTRLAMAIEQTIGGDIAGRNIEFARYSKRYLPKAVRTVALLDDDNELHRIVDMGPTDGIPVVCLHPMILSDFREQDIALLNELKLRLIWPLRNGLIAPMDPILTEADHLRHACKGIETVRKFFVGDTLPILSFNASSKVALAYAKANPDKVEALFFAGICVQNDAAKGARRLGRGMIALASQNRPLMNAIAGYFQRFVFTPNRTRQFLTTLFRSRPADRMVLETEFQGPFGSERLRDSLIASSRSAMHDFAFQQAMDWDTAHGLNAEMHFLHGVDDVIHPLALVESLAASIAGVTLHRLPGAGDLLYHQHFKSVLIPVAARLAQ